MGNFGDAERRILAFMAEGTEFVFQEKNYKIILSGKPTCHKGEPKTDIYILAESASDKVEIKISYKKENADFIEKSGAGIWIKENDDIQNILFDVLGNTYKLQDMKIRARLIAKKNSTKDICEKLLG